MSIRHAILGFLSWKPFSGYELKKLLSDSPSFYWSGNSNQVYGCLLALHAEGAVSCEVQEGERYPARKVYSLAAKGREELKAWLMGGSELPEIRNHFQMRLAWAEALSSEELDAVFEGYESLLRTEILMCRETARREEAGEASGAPSTPARSPREALIWKRVAESRVAAYEAELAWSRALRSELARFGSEGPAGS